MNKLIHKSVTELSQLIRTQKVSSLEIVRAFIKQIHKVNKNLNAVIQMDDEDHLIAQAIQADQYLAQGVEIGALHGIPITVKDSFDTKDICTTWGTPGRVGYIPKTDGTAVARLKAAGAIILGKTNTSELTLGWDTVNPVFGRTKNPYNLGCSPGGSSGGAAAIVAAGGSPLDIGSDSWGSIRVPSHFCGISGIKPTSGRVPRTGHAIGPGTYLDRITQVGPIAKYIEDLELVLPILCGPDFKDPSIVPAPIDLSTKTDVRGMTAAFYINNGITSVTSETAGCIHRAVTCLAEKGVCFTENRPPGIETSLKLIHELSMADNATWAGRVLASCNTQLNRTSLHWIGSGAPIQADAFTQLIAQWDQFQFNMLDFIRKYDFILCPVCAHPAPLLTQPPSEDVECSVFSYTLPYNLTGYPAVTVRAGTSISGLPIGIQIVGKPWREDIILAAAKQIESAIGGWQMATFIPETNNV